MDALFEDDVHVTDLGGYFVSLVTYSIVYRRNPVGAAAPPSITSGTALALQEFAWNFVQRHYAGYKPLSLDECRKYVVERFNSLYWSYEYDIGFARDEGVLRAYAKVVRLRFQWKRRFAVLDSHNPFYFEPGAGRTQ
jgi:hypothetical protein